jgi:PAS domain S-box-containing protein
VATALGLLFHGLPATGGNSQFLIQSWQDQQGLPESSALAVAQTPDGYIWVGTLDGLLRFDGVNFVRPEKFSDLPALSGIISFLQTDRSGRLWAGGQGHLVYRDQSGWHELNDTNLYPRSVAEDRTGQVFIGGTEGQLYAIVNGQAKSLPAPEGLKPSGSFWITDEKDGGIWLANRGFIGRYTAAAGWERCWPGNSIPSSVIATPAHAGGLWVFTPGTLWRFHTNGTANTFAAPRLDQPREILEDRNGTLWIATITGGLVSLQPGVHISSINKTNGLVHNAIRCLLEDKEGNLWAGGSMNGLTRLKPRQFTTFAKEDGLPDNIVRTVTETRLGRIVVGTHGGGIVRLTDGQVEVTSPMPFDSECQYVWSVLQDRQDRLWIGTYDNGLFVQNQGLRRPFPLPDAFLKAVGQLMEDSRGRIWVGGPGTLGVIEGEAMTTYFTNSPIANYAITSLAEDTHSGKIWVGTYIHGVYEIDSLHLDHIKPLPGLPGNRISLLAMDPDGCLWIGIYEHGLACWHDGKLTLVGAQQGLPALTIGSLLDDGHGCFWLGTTHGILRVASSELHRLARQSSPPAVFSLFNTSDGLDSDFCIEGYQPNAVRDHTGRLWFGTDGGVVAVDPQRVRINTNPPPVFIRGFSFADRDGKRIALDPRAGPLAVPPGGGELEFTFDALSYTAPEKVKFKYQLEGVNPDWISLGHDHGLQFHKLPPGRYTLRVTAANNDGIWNETGATLSFAMQPYLWQTVWFRLLALVVVAGGGALGVRRVTRRQYLRRIEQLEQQRRLEQERAHHAAVMENTSDLVVFADSQGGLLHLNASGRKLLGLSPDETVSGRPLASLQPQGAAETVAREGIPAARARGTWETETTLLHRDGHEIPVSLVLIVHKDAAGQEAFLSAIARDITGRKHAEAQLQRREKYFRWLIEHASDSITVINPQTIVTYQSSSGERLLGYPAETIVGRNMLELMHPDDVAKARAALEQTLAQTDVPVTLVARLRHRDGAWRTIETVGTSAENENHEKQVVLNSRDLTENLKLEEELRQAQKMEAVGQLAGGVAHDFNNILTSLRLQAELMGMNENLPDNVREGLQQICADTHRAADLTRQLLLFSRRQVMQSRLVDLNQVVMNVAKLLGRIIREDVRLQMNLHPKPLMTMADPGMLDQVLINLAVNARDAMPKGGWLRIETSETTVNADDAQPHPDAAPGRYVVFSVKDSGGGIPPEVVPHIFEPFFTTKEAGKGTGLGLATVFGIVKQHRGWIKLDNEPGQGAMFQVYLPASTATATAAARAGAPAPPPRGSETILLVEDEPAVRKSTRMILERHGYKILEAADGMEAIKIWKEHRVKVALLLTDLVMPGGVGGRELGGQLKLERPGLKIIYASGYSADIAGRDFQLQRGEAFIQKPFITAHLLETIRRCIDG